MGDWKFLGRLHIFLALGGLVLVATNSRTTNEVTVNSKFDATAASTVPLTIDFPQLKVVSVSKNHTVFHIDSRPLPSLAPPPPSADGTPRNHSIIYVHIGKTGGTTLDKVLTSNCMWYEGGFRRRKCLKELPRSSMLSELTKATLHFGPRRDYNAWIENATMFLVSLRNPISRVVSAFNFDHPSNSHPNLYTKGMPDSVRHFFIECFPTIQHLADLLHSAEHNKSGLSRLQQTCYDTAGRTLAGWGSVEGAPQLKMNYEFYNQMSMGRYPDRPVLVLRTEHLWEDLLNIDRILGGSGHFDHVGRVYTHGSQSHSVRQGLSRRGKEIVCCYLAKEMHLYEALVRGAINLIPPEMNETIVDVYEQCGVAVDESFSWEKWSSVACPQAATFFSF